MTENDAIRLQEFTGRIKEIFDKYVSDYPESESDTPWKKLYAIEQTLESNKIIMEDRDDVIQILKNMTSIANGEVYAIYSALYYVKTSKDLQRKNGYEVVKDHIGTYTIRALTLEELKKDVILYYIKEPFSTDQEAVAWVKQQAAANDQICKQVIEFLTLVNSPNVEV